MNIRIITYMIILDLNIIRVHVACNSIISTIVITRISIFSIAAMTVPIIITSNHAYDMRMPY